MGLGLHAPARPALHPSAKIEDAQADQRMKWHETNFVIYISTSQRNFFDFLVFWSFFDFLYFFDFFVVFIGFYRSQWLWDAILCNLAVFSRPELQFEVQTDYF